MVKCKNCRHCKPDRSSTVISFLFPFVAPWSWRDRMDFAKCLHFSAEYLNEPDLHLGESVGRGLQNSHCSTMRAGKCGPDARFFEQR